MKELFE
jgi:hypothetical protein